VMVPWVVFVPPVIFALARPGGLETTERRRGWQYLISIMAGPLLLLSMASAKRPGYLLPLMPAFAVSVAAWLDGALQEVEGGWMRVWRAGGTVTLALAAVAAWGASGYLAVKAHAGVAVSAVGVAAALAGVVALGLSLRREGQQRLPVMAAGLALLMVFSLFSPSTFAAIDARRGYHTLTAAVAEWAVPGTTLYGYDMGERELGVMGFMRQAPTPQVVSPQALREVFRDRQSLVLVSVEAMKKLQAQGDWPDTAEVVAAPEMPDRPYVVVRGKV
jgi:4-amino-4-deoxy-L-arabinose transferase-like glycosyltransferase